MQTAMRRRTRSAVAASALAHAALLVAVLLYRPHLASPVELAVGPQETAIPIFLAPRSHVPQAARPPSVVAPLSRPAPASAGAAPASPTRPSAETSPAGPPSAGPVPEDRASGPDIRAALRHGAVGCANLSATGMSRDEREHCEDRFAAGAKTDAMQAIALEPRMRAYYDAVIKAKAPDKPWTPNRAIGALNRFDPEPRASNDHLPGVGCVFPFTYGQKQTAKQKKAARRNALPHALWLGPCFIEPPKGSLDPEVDVPVP